MGAGGPAPMPLRSGGFGRSLDVSLGGRRGVRGLAPMRAEVRVGLGAVAARDRDVELGVAPHAVLVDVEADRLDLRLDADAPQLVHGEQRAERRAERERADGDDAERLYADLV